METGSRLAITACDEGSCTHLPLGFRSEETSAATAQPMDERRGGSLCAVLDSPSQKLFQDSLSFLSYPKWLLTLPPVTLIDGRMTGHS